MKVYVLTTHAVADYDDYGINNRVFANEQDAINELKEWREDEIKHAQDNEWVIGCDYDTHFEAYEDGCWCQNHSVAFIREEIVH